MFFLQNESIGEKHLITTNEWFIAPDGNQYKAAFGVLYGIYEDSSLGIKTNRHSTNWFVQLGGMTIAGCQIHYAIKTDDCELGDIDDYEIYQGEVKKTNIRSRIYAA